MTAQPDLVLVVSGKRKSGKDFICDKLFRGLGDKYLVQLVTLSAPLKQAYAIENRLNFEKLLDSSDYKENYRLKMIE
jgi:phosphomevalonate kinase